MLKRLSTIFIVCIVALIFIQCQRPSFVLDEKRMTAVTKDMVLTEAYLQQNYLPDSIAALYYESVLEKHGISRAKYDSSLVWYSENSHRLSDIYSLIEKELKEVKNLTDTFLADSLHRYRIRFERPTFESGNLWANSSRLMIPPSTTLWPYTQNVTPQNPFQSSDTITWTAEMIGESPTSIDLTAQLLIVSQQGYKYEKLKSTPTIDKNRWESTFVLPDSLPELPRFTLILLLRKSQEPLYLQHIYLGKPAPISLKTPELLKLEEPKEPENAMEQIEELPQ